MESKIAIPEQNYQPEKKGRHSWEKRENTVFGTNITATLQIIWAYFDSNLEVFQKTQLLKCENDMCEYHIIAYNYIVGCFVAGIVLAKIFVLEYN